MLFPYKYMEAFIFPGMVRWNFGNPVNVLHLTGQLFVLHSVLVCLKWDRPATSMLRGCFEFLETFLFI